MKRIHQDGITPSKDIARKKETLSFEPKDCYTIGEIAKKFHINDKGNFHQCPIKSKAEKELRSFAEYMAFLLNRKPMFPILSPNILSG